MLGVAVGVGVLSVQLGRGLGADTVGGREVSAHVPRPRLVNGGRDLRLTLRSVGRSFHR